MPMTEAADVPTIAGDLAAALDAVVFAERAGVRPDAWQADVLRTDARQLILLASRQSGKSTVTALLAAHQAVYGPDTLTLLLSPSLRQSQELYRKVRVVLAALGRTAPPAAEESALRLELDNGARVVCLPGKEATIRGFSAPALVVEDEASRVDDALYQAIRPMLATSGGRLVLLSTPWGQRGHFHHEWAKGGDAWARFAVTAEQVPRISAAFLARERAAMPSFVYRQEYGCEFVQPDDAYFQADDIDAAFVVDGQPLFPLEEANPHAAD